MIPDEMVFMKEDLTGRHLDNLDEAISLPGTEQQICIRMFFLKDKSYKEICMETGYEINMITTFRLKNNLT
jgi:hypothetical protein